MVSRALMTPLSTITRMENHGEDSMIALKSLKEITPMDICYKECDVLLPCAIERSFTAHNCGKLKCKIMSEGANGPVTAEVKQSLMKEISQLSLIN